MNARLLWAAVVPCLATAAMLQSPGAMSEKAQPGAPAGRPVRPLAQACVEVYRSPDPKRIYCYSPGLARCPTGRLVATLDRRAVGGAKLDGPTYGRDGATGVWQGKVFTSDDRGKTWTHRADFPFLHARPFVAGKRLYVLGQAGDLTVIASDDWGESFSKPARLTRGRHWHQAPCNVHYANGCVYLVMERRTARRVTGWSISENAPVLMRAKVTDDLTRRASWTFASELTFCDAVGDRRLDHHGIPFYDVYYPDVADVGGGRICSPIGWLEANVVQFVDPDHLWHDPNGRTFHLWMRAHTGTTGYAAIARVVEGDDGKMTTSLVKAPSGKAMVFVPCPGGQMKFHILYDERTRLYWLLSTQATDSMTRPERLPRDRYNLPNNERRRLQLHFSRNCIDWCFAGLVAVGPAERASRHYASMVIDGDDLHILSRSGDRRAANAHDTDLITFHTVADFRRLAY